MRRDSFPQVKRVSKPNVITNGQFITEGNNVHPSAEGCIVTGTGNTVGEGCKNVTLLNSSGCIVSPGVVGSSAINSSGTIISQSNTVTINNARVGSQTYRANLNQNGTSDPVAYVLTNTFPGNIVWTRLGVGNYIGTLVGAFEGGHNKMFVTLAPYGESQYIITTSPDSVQINAKVAGVPTDDTIIDNSIEITRYDI